MSESPLRQPALFHVNPFGTVTGAGVDIFFVISGFVMVYVSGPYRQRKKPVSDFMIRRLLRIYPLYAVATVLTLLIYAYNVYIQGAPAFYDQQPHRVLGAFLFVPTFDQAHDISPIVDVGWTLYYEMLFYAVFAMALFVSRNRLIVAVTAILLFLMGGANVLGWADALSVFLRNTIVIEFIFGCILGSVFLSGRLPRWHPMIYFSLGVAGFTLHPYFPPDQWRFLMWGAPAFMVVAGCLELERLRKSAWSPKWLEFGEISYAVYLFHMMIIYNLAYRLVLKISGPVTSNWVTDLVIIATVMAALAVGASASRFIERPLRRGLTHLYRSNQQRAPALAK